MPRISNAEKDKMIDSERDSKIDYTGLSETYCLEMGPQFEGEPVRKGDFHVELGGPNAKGVGFLRLRKMDEIEDGQITLTGPDLKDMEEGGSYPLGFIIDIAGEQWEEGMEIVPERRIHSYLNYIEGVWQTGARTDSWMRIHKDAFQRGLQSLNELGRILRELYMADFFQVKKVACTFITDEAKVDELIEEAKEVYKQRDARMKDMTEEEVEDFYSCTLCSAFAPSHVCIITPERISSCGALTWLDGKITHQIEPGGYVGKHPKGELVDPENFEYSGINDAVKEKSMGRYDRLYLHSLFGFPSSSCGCFQALLFYIPEVDGIGFVHREYRGDIPNGETFSSMAGEASGGVQAEGYLGSSIDYLRSPKFLATDGGHKRLVWIPKEIKEELRDDIQEDLFDKIATEDDVSNIEELTDFLERTGHPCLS